MDNYDFLKFKDFKGISKRCQTYHVKMAHLFLYFLWHIDLGLYMLFCFMIIVIDIIFFCSFTSAIRSGLTFSGSEVITLGGGEELWLYINKKLVVEIVQNRTTSDIPCQKIDLSTANGKCIFSYYKLLSHQITHHLLIKQIKIL